MATKSFVSKTLMTSGDHGGENESAWERKREVEAQRKNTKKGFSRNDIRSVVFLIDLIVTY